MLGGIRDIVIFVGWPILVFASILIFVKGRHIYHLVRNSLVGKVTKALVYSLLVNLSSLGIICTLYIFSDSNAVKVVLPVLVVWLIVFIWTLRTIMQAEREARGIVGHNAPQDQKKRK